jgi:hypothetical protein
MLVNKKVLGVTVLVPFDMNDDLLNFIIRDAGQSRFIIGMHIPAASGYKFIYDTCHIAVCNGELKVHSQRASRTYQLHMYAWEHIYCLMPSAKAKRKKGSGWVDPDIAGILVGDEFPSAWHSADIRAFVKEAQDAS